VRKVLPSATSGLLLCLVCACSEQVEPRANGATDTRATKSTTVPAGACTATLSQYPLLESPHVVAGTSVAYNSNPPSSGPHYAVWAAFREYDKAIDRRHYVHDLEHGAIVFLYKCSKASDCPDVVTQLRSVVAAVPTDARCAASIKNRVLLVPDPMLDSKVAAAAWGHTYRADCVDPTTLLAFAAEHYARSPEDICADGQADF
jgi:hypothetical protein